MSHNLKCRLLYLQFFILLISCSNDDRTNTDQNNQCSEGKTSVFIEKDGLITIEAEKAISENTPWKLQQNVANYSDQGYLVWDGDDLFNQPGNGILTYTIRITTPGTYRFIWRSHITIGDDNTEHNDSWLRIPDASHFYGKKNDGHIVYPKGTSLPPIPDSAGQISTEPEGGGKNGWFKVFMNRIDQWDWRSSTSDNDSHNIYVVFNTAGDYTIQISGRSKGHAIDKFVLFTENVTSANATSDDGTASEIICE